MKKFFLVTIAAALIASIRVIAAPVGGNSNFVSIGAPVVLTNGAAATNTVDTSSFVGKSAIVVNYKLSAGANLSLSFAGAITNGAPYVSMTNGVWNVGSITNGTCYALVFPAQDTVGRFIRVIAKATGGNVNYASTLVGVK